MKYEESKQYKTSLKEGDVTRVVIRTGPWPVYLNNSFISGKTGIWLFKGWDSGSSTELVTPYALVSVERLMPDKYTWKFRDFKTGDEINHTGSPLSAAVAVQARQQKKDSALAYYLRLLLGEMLPGGDA